MSEVEMGSVIEQIRQRRKEMSSNRTVEMDIPGYQGRLVGRYQPIEWDRMQELARKGEANKANPEAILMVSADGLADACVCMCFRDGEGKVTPITKDGEQVRYDKNFAQVLGIEGETVREIVRNTFFTPDAIVTHYGEFLVWQREGNEEVTQDLSLELPRHPTSASSRKPPPSE